MLGRLSLSPAESWVCPPPAGRAAESPPSAQVLGGSLPERNAPARVTPPSRESPQPMAGDKLGSSLKGAPFPALAPGGRWVLVGPSAHRLILPRPFLWSGVGAESTPHRSPVSPLPPSSLPRSPISYYSRKSNLRPKNITATLEISFVTLPGPIPLPVFS